MTAPDPELVARLRAAGCVFAEEEAQLLEDEAALVDGGHPGAALERLVARRVAGEPLEVVLGWAAFRGLRVAVGPGVFVPRRRTELLVDLALRSPALVDPASAATVLDLCCGAGAVARAIEAERPYARVVAADIDERATAVARQNLRDPRSVFTGDLFEALPASLRGRIDVIVANAPYVPSGEIAFMPQEARLHEPILALDGGPTGTELHARIADGAAEWLAPGGTVIIETSERQAEATANHLEAAGFSAAGRTAADVGSDSDATAVVGVHRVMPTKITFVYDNPTDPQAFEAGYPDVLAKAKALPGITKVETSRVWPKEDGTATPAYRLVDLYFTDYEAASAAVATEAAGALFPAVFELATGGVRILFADIEEG